MRFSVIVAILFSAAVFAAPIQEIELGEDLDNMDLEEFDALDSMDADLKLPSLKGLGTGIVNLGKKAIGALGKKLPGILKKGAGSLASGATEAVGNAATTALIKEAQGQGEQTQ